MTAFELLEKVDGWVGRRKRKARRDLGIRFLRCVPVITNASIWFSACNSTLGHFETNRKHIQMLASINIRTPRLSVYLLPDGARYVQIGFIRRLKLQNTCASFKV
jgi:hypothetical protein